MTFVATKLFHKAGEGSGGGGGGGDQHNLGWYATESALTTAHPTASNGDWAIVGATDTVWVWDSDTTAWKDTGQAGIELPDQTGNSGKFLTTDGTAASWSDKPLVNQTTASNSLSIDGSSYVGQGSTVVGHNASGSQGNYNTVLGASSQARNASVAIGPGINNFSGANAVTIRSGATTLNAFVGGVADSFTWVYKTTPYVLCQSDGTIPEARLADTTNAAQGQVLALDSNLDAVWTTPSGGLPSQTGNSGKFLTTDGTDASWSDKPLTNRATGTGSLAIGNNNTTASLANSVVIGYDSYINGGSGSSVAIGKGVSVYTECVSIGSSSSANDYGTIAIGANSKALATRAIQIGYGSNTEAGTLSIGLFHNNQFPNYKLLDSDGTIPTARLTKVNTTVTLASAGWSNGSQTVTVTGMTATGVVLVSPDPTDQAAYTSAGILCTAQAADSLTFTATTTPTGDIDVNVVML